MRNDVSEIARHFSRASICYKQGAALQRAVAQQLCSELPAINPGAVLEVGCGTGFLTDCLLQQFPTAQLDAIDLSQAMLDVARENVCRNGRVRWICGDANTISLTRRYDLIVSSSSLQWFPSLEKILKRFREMLVPEGHLGVSLMLAGTFAELHQLRSEVVPTKPRERVLPSFIEVGRALSLAKFCLIAAREEERIEKFRDAWTFVNTIHRLGFTGGMLSHARSLLTRGELTRLMTSYQQRFGSERGVLASYRVGYFHAKPNQ